MSWYGMTQLFVNRGFSFECPAPLNASSHAEINSIGFPLCALSFSAHGTFESICLGTDLDASLITESFKTIASCHI